ncbi:hypothetical protein FEM48_Zijuj08G0184600 [Ziziphus jujuba var. spinosa]|uniref:RING-type E3 ubiquitin transferase n=1 Tax=Ziziphus jujuba var. spinosa TaxID=714518 RepID=A0A978V0N5_ZIZJJ|nr:hypothetical protein FEM48_Zijuj08G0184600 [Ziziphus jujuba var. spinosa]
MSASSSSPTSHLFLIQNLVGDFYSRRLLLQNPLNQQSSPSSPASPPPSATSHDPSDEYAGDNSFDANVVMVLSVLLCALICSLGLNSIIRCALRCSSIVASESRSNPNSSRLANTGVKKKALKTFPTVSYSADLKLPGLDTECVICLSEFTAGERVRLLPKCNHGFHVRCIDKWLSSHSSCPKCRHNLLETCQKIVGCNQQQTASSSISASAVPETIVSIAPLEPEGLIRNYRETS